MMRFASRELENWWFSPGNRLESYARSCKQPRGDVGGLGVRVACAVVNRCGMGSTPIGSTIPKSGVTNRYFGGSIQEVSGGLWALTPHAKDAVDGRMVEPHKGPRAAVSEMGWPLFLLPVYAIPGARGTIL